VKPLPQGSDDKPSDPAAVRQPAGSLYLKLSVFLAGACIMSAEMAAPRLLAPYFGTSQIIWANIIGTVLAAITAGAFVGGRLADRWPNEAAYGRAIAIGGVCLAVVPLLSPPLLRAATGALATRSVGTFLLSLAAVCLFFAPPVFVLGMVSPWAVKLAGAGRRDLGRVAGVLSGLGAGGSIFGTFFSALVLLPFLGTRRTILATAALLVATGAWRAFGDVRVRTCAIVLAALLVFHSFGGIKKSTGLIYETESFYQYIQVRRSSRGSTILQLNEGLGSHSIKPPGGHLTGGYWDNMSVLPVMVSRPGGRLRVLILGLAAGTMAWQLDHYYSGSRELEIDGVELDPEVVEAGRRFFDLGSVGHLNIHVADARPFVESAKGEYDLIIADAFQQPYIPFHMVTREFYQACLERLAPGGAFCINLGADEGGRELVDAFAATTKSVFPHVALFIRKKRRHFANYLYVGSRVRLTPPDVRLTSPDARMLPPDLRAVALPEMVDTWHEVAPPPDAFVFTDDRAPIEFFIHRMLLNNLTGRSST